MIDDILNTGRTFSEAAKIVEREGATEIYAVSSHGLFVEGAADLLDATNIKNPCDRLRSDQRKLQKMYVTLLLAN